MKSGTRAVGVAESYRGARSTLAAVVVRADNAVESVSFGTCTVGGSDATSAVCGLLDDLERPDARFVFVAGVALAWYNVLDLEAIAAHADRPVLAVSFEESDGLESSLREAFDGDELDARLAAYRALPERRRVAVGESEGGGECEDEGECEGEGEDVLFVRAVGIEDTHADEIVHGFTRDRGRPEPVRVAREVARGGDAFRRRLDDEACDE